MLGPGVIVAVAAAGCTAIWLGDPTAPGGFLPTCPTKLLFGVTCPGCGSMRMIYALLHGDVPAALHFNGLGVVAIALLVYAFVAYSVGLWRGRRVRSWQHLRYAPMIALVAVVSWFIVRNVPIEPLWSLHV
ncbi:DUF2752 domain-containing protein [Gordonia rhizosphera]|uniref:DUF2752 domain-containing protein n=1 Tax=Gordonia rhizosphera NBRC 16068 TaxID=1108045 RepID=K6WBZ7_9ACTN|nr:DUF2752 domain-containing protein [Gordonia rhizosphera]GAB89717.1 hypothetical protein GORHZ_069_00960 [Gordonia rhizosphera NBRC 16068]